METRERQLNSGFTLVEIIVSIAIFSAVLAVLGSVMVAGFKYFYETSSTDLNKRATDVLISYIRGELIYATDVQVVNTKPEGDWYSFSIDNGLLKQYDTSNNDLKVFDNKSFYNNNNLKMFAKAYENKNRLDIKLTLSDSKETLYTTRDTLELLNINAILTAPFGDEQEVGHNDLKIYYKRDKNRVVDNNSGNVLPPDDPNSEVTGTVADIRLIANGYNFRGVFNTLNNYHDGEIVWHNGYYWEKINNQENIYAPGVAIEENNEEKGNYSWKRLTSAYTNKEHGEDEPNCLYSGYERGDIVIYNNKYYKVKKDINNEYAAWIFQDWDNQIKSEYWVELGSVNDPAVENIVKQNEYIPKKVYSQETIWARFFPKSLTILDPTYPTIKEFENGKEYKVGDIIKAKSDDPNYYYLYIQRRGKTKNNIGDPKNGWTRIDVAYDPNSYYKAGDILWLVEKENGSFYWIVAVKDVKKSYSADDVYNSINNPDSKDYEHYWRKVN